MFFVPDDVGRGAWDNWGFEGPRHPCAECFWPVGEGLVYRKLWAIGSQGPEPLIGTESHDAYEDMRTQAQEHGSPIVMGGFVFYHPTCMAGSGKRLKYAYLRLRQEMNAGEWPEDIMVGGRPDRIIQDKDGGFSA